MHIRIFGCPTIPCMTDARSCPVQGHVPDQGYTLPDRRYPVIPVHCPARNNHAETESAILRSSEFAPESFQVFSGEALREYRPEGSWYRSPAGTVPPARCKAQPAQWLRNCCQGVSTGYLSSKASARRKPPRNAATSAKLPRSISCRPSMLWTVKKCNSFPAPAPDWVNNVPANCRLRKITP